MKSVLNGRFWHGGGIVSRPIPTRKTKGQRGRTVLNARALTRPMATLIFHGGAWHLQRGIQFPCEYVLFSCQIDLVLWLPYGTIGGCRRRKDISKHHTQESGQEKTIAFLGLFLRHLERFVNECPEGRVNFCCVCVFKLILTYSLTSPDTRSCRISSGHPCTSLFLMYIMISAFSLV